MKDMLIQQIIEEFKTDNHLYYSSVPFYENIVKIADSHEITLSSFYWMDALNSETGILSNILFWFEKEVIFDYFFPALLIYCLKTNFMDSEALLCLTNKLERDNLGFGRCNYANSLSRLNSIQRDLFSQFLHQLNQKTTEYEIQYLAAYKALSWFECRDNLIKSIKIAFHHSRLSIENVADDTDRFEGEFLCQHLNNVSWQELLTDKKKLALVIYGYLFLYDEAFCYFMPACMIATLYDEFDDYFGHSADTEISSRTIYNLCLIDSPKQDTEYNRLKYDHFNSEQRTVIVEFLRLMFDITQDDNILSSVRYYWLEGKSNI